MSPIVDLRRDHRQLLSLIALLSPAATTDPGGWRRTGDCMRQRMEHLGRALADHVQRESAVFAGIALGATRMARWYDTMAIGIRVSALALRWRMPGALESDAPRYASAVTGLRSDIARLIRRDEDCMFALARGRTDRLDDQNVHRPYPGLSCAVERVLAALEMFRSSAGSAGSAGGASNRQIDLLRSAAERMLAYEASMMADCLPAGTGDLLQEGLRMHEMMDEIAYACHVGGPRSADNAVAFVHRWVQVHAAETEALLLGYGYRADAG